MAFKVGDKVRLTGPKCGLAHYPGVGAIVTVEQIENGRPWASDGANGLLSFDGEVYDGFEFELVEEPELLAPEVGGTVKLTGPRWGGDNYSPGAGTEHEILRVEADGALAVIADDWYVYLDPESSHLSMWGGEVVAAAPLQAEPEPSNDSTGYPVGTPRAEKDLPSTQQIKGTYKGLGDADGTQAAFLAEFNRWYEQERAEFEQDGFQAGYKQAMEDIQASLPEYTYLVFVGEFEQHDEVQAAEDRVNELLQSGQYAKILQGVREKATGAAIGFQVNEPTLGLARPGVIR